MKKKDVILAKQNKLTVAVDSGVGILQKNAKQSLSYFTAGNELIDRINKEGGMTEALADEANSYVAECRAAVMFMNRDRRPFTQRLTEIQKQFVSFENNIDPTKKSTPANELIEMRNAFLMKKRSRTGREAYAG